MTMADPLRAVLRVLAVSANPHSTITQVRVARPISELLARQGGELRLRSLHDTPSFELDWCNVLVVQRGMARRHLDLMRTAATMGRAVVYEIDDLLTEPAPHLQHAQALQSGAIWVRKSLEVADVVTLSTERLRTLLGLARDHCVLVPNAAFDAPLPAPPALPPASPHTGVTVLVAASDRVAGAAAWAALKTLTQAAGDAVSVIAVGPVAEDLRLAGVHCRCLPLMPRDAFVHWAATQPNAVAVIPLDDSRFSAGKSAVKWFDYAVAGVPTLASDVPPYCDVIESCRTGWLVGPSVEAWQQALHAVLGDVPARARVAAAACAQVQANHHAGLTRKAWDQALHGAIVRAAGRGRMPTYRPLSPLHRAWQDVVLSLRRWNRERLGRRH
jgi:hypothetical protein